MNSHDLSFLILGAGAVGGITAALMKKNGYNVEIICKYDDYSTLISDQGINVKGVCGEFSVRMAAFSSINNVKGKKDVILHATKATDMHDATIAAMKVLNENGCFVSLQNGICEDEMMTIAGKDKVAGCVTGWGATMESPGNLVMTSGGDFILGYPGREPDEFLSLLAEALSSVVPVKMTGNIMGHLYSKLIINSCITSLGAICGLYLGKMLSLPKVRRIFIEIIKEAVALSEKMNLKTEIFGGRLDFSEFVKGNDFFSDLRRHFLIMIIGFKYRKLKSSSLQSLERGKATEVDYLNGYIVRNAEKYGVEVPVNRAIVEMIHEIELKKRKISVANFDTPVFSRFS
jgi:2-dehydropantoate 2-reductase